MDEERTHYQTALDALVRFVEAEAPGLLGAIVPPDPDGGVRLGAAPSLPREFFEALDGSPIGTCADASGRARVGSVDLRGDPRWAGCREAANTLGLRAAWLRPILSSQGTVLGCFAAFFRESRAPGEREVRLIDVAAQVAALVLQRRRMAAAAHERSRAAAYLGRVVTLGELSGNLAHELNQPLAAILCNAQAAQRLLRREVPDLGEVDAGLREIVLAGRRAGAVIGRLCAQVRKEPVRPALLDVDELAVATIDLARADLWALGVSLELDLALRLPPVMGDAAQLQQVILNLIVNACDAMTPERAAERRLTIASRLSTAGDAVELEVGDSGPGIPEDELERVFEPFYTRKPFGMGLGLAVCRSVVQGHRGRLWASNNPDRGATFHLALPVAGEEAAGERAP